MIFMAKMRLYTSWIGVVLFSLVYSNIVFASASNWVNDQAETGLLQARLILAQNYATGSFLDGAIEIRLKPKWKTYWKHPGDAGIPPSFDWTNSNNIGASDVLFPVPERFSIFGLETFGYENRVAFPFKIEILDPDLPVHLNVDMSLLVCEEVCVPIKIVLSVDVASGKALQTNDGVVSVVDFESAAQLVEFNGYLPQPSVMGAIRVSKVFSDKEFQHLHVRFDGFKLGQEFDVIPIFDSGWSFKKPEILFDQELQQIHATFVVNDRPSPEASLSGHKIAWLLVNKTLQQGWEFDPLLIEQSPLDISSTIELLDRAGSSGKIHIEEEKPLNLITILLIGFLGGLLLNVMPCVLPVLSLKIFSVLNKTQQSMQSVRVSFLGNIAGIFVTFFSFALIATLLSITGNYAGWGIHFQQPAFVYIMALVILVFAGSMMGWYKIDLPILARTWMLKFLNKQETTSNDKKSKFIASLFEGMFATFLATPCSAPFLGTAIGFAFAAANYASIFMIFFALAAGMSLPLIVFAIKPSYIRMLPKPGAWTQKIERILAIFLFLTALWLFWILSAQLPKISLLLVSASALLVILFLVFKQSNSTKLHKAGFISLCVASICLITTLNLDNAIDDEQSSSSNQKYLDINIQTERFDIARVNQLVNEGKRVFVDVTAEWCISCIYNKEVVLNDPNVQLAMQAGDVVFMQADWTNPNPAIESYLASFGRYAIPFNVIYGPANKNGAVLPVLLSVSNVIQALEQTRFK